MIGVLSVLRVVLLLAATVYVAVYHLVQIVLLVLAWREARRQRRGRPLWHPRQVATSPELPGISVIVPAFNEEVTIVRTVESILGSAYPKLEVLVVNDGSTDATLARLIDAFDLRPIFDRGEAVLPTQPVRQLLGSRGDVRLRVLDKHNGGKADALNVGLNYAQHRLVCCTDADVIVDPHALFHLVRPFLDDPTTVASSGGIRLRNGARIEDGRIRDRRFPDGWIERFQILEYLRAFSVGRLAFNHLDSHLIISGAFGLFSRATVMEVGGYQPFAIGEDMELVVRLHRHLRERRRPYRIAFVADAICYTEAPDTAGELGRQRTRWHQGLLTTLRLHRRMLLNRAYGAIGVLAIPYFLLFELWAPVIELLGWLLLPVGLAAGWYGGSEMLGFLLAAMVLGTAVSLVAVAVDVAELRFFSRPRDVLRLCFLAVLEHFGYHQLTLYWRWRAFPRYYRSIHLRGGWRSPKRAESPAEAPVAADSTTP